MTEILFCNKPIHRDSAINQCGIKSSDIHGLGCGSSIDTLRPYTPYLVGNTPNSLERNLLNQLGTGAVAHNITNMSLSFGEDSTLALAEITAKLQESGVAMMGASTSIYGSRVNGFGLAVKKYQEALLAYRDAIKSNSTARSVAKERAFSAFREMQSRFRHELVTVTSVAKTRKGTALGNPIRGTNIARSSRNIAKLDITSQVQASQFVQYGKYTKFLGNGLAIIDFGGRVANVHSNYKRDGNWERELFIESSSFALSATTSAAVISAGGAALSFLVAATPIGWIGLVIGGGSCCWFSSRSRYIREQCS